MIKTVDITFRWREFMPDRRQWKPSSPVFEPQFVQISLPVPLDEKHFANVEEMKEGKINQPILTLAGMKYCIDRFEEVMSDEPKQTDDESEYWDDFEWTKANTE